MVDAITAVGLFTFGLTYLAKFTDGPFDIFIKFRKMMGIRRIPVLDDEGNVIDYIEEADGSFTSKLVACWWCFSTWVALNGTILMMPFTISGITFGGFTIMVFGSVGVAGIIYTLLERYG